MQKNFTCNNWGDWLFENLVKAYSLYGSSEWNITFAIILDTLWRRRNEVNSLRYYFLC